MNRPTLDEYREQLRSLTNEELVAVAGTEILGAATLESRGHPSDWADECCGAILDEARRRGNTDLYQRGFNDAARSQGHSGLTRKVETPLSVGEPN